MGFLKRLFAQPSSGSGSVSSSESRGIEATLFYGDERLEVKGESFYQDNLRHVVTQLGREIPAILIPEPDNEYDRNAVSVWCGGLKVGHLTREDAAVYQSAIARLTQQEGKPIAVTGRIFGGEPTKPSLGIWLYHDPTDFGLHSARGRRVSSGTDVLTGATEGGLRWMDTLPADRLAAIKTLRKHLTIERSPIQRHFMFNTLEEYLYACREVFTSALDEFDETCERHHLEMDSIRGALVEEFGGLPMVPMYRQMAIRKEKARSYAEALVWVNRGLSLYGDQCLREDAVVDLNKRVAKLRVKVGQSSNA